MESMITIKKDYILVEIRERAFLEITALLGHLFKTHDYLNKDAIWLFRQGLLQMNYEDLYKIKDFIIEHYPDNAKRDKRVALVAETGFDAAMATEYVRIVEGLPLDFRVFSDFNAAEEWIVGQDICLRIDPPIATT